MNAFVSQFTDSQFLFAVFAAIAAAATVITIGLPYLQTDRLSSRMKYVASEREEMRKRERARLQANQSKRPSLRSEPKAYVRNVVERLKLQQGLATEETVNKLRMAGFRGQSAIYTFLFFRLVLPFVFFLVALLYLFTLRDFDQPAIFKFCIAFGVAYLGFYAPNIYVRNRITKRQQSISRAWPDALDLLLICVESGMSIEAAFKKVANEIGAQSISLAEEMSLTNAELSYLQDRRQAYENLAKRAGLEGVKAVVTSLIQAERYGTPLGQSLRVMAQENRDMRMAAAEKKAAALPPKLTVPMIVFFLPVLFVVIMAPALMGVMETFG